MTTYKIAVLPGDGIGPEVMDEALKVLDAVSKKYDIKYETKHALIGWAAWPKYKNHFPDDTKKFVIGVMQFCIDQFEVLLINNLNLNGLMLKKMQFFE